MKTCGTCRHWKFPGRKWRKCTAAGKGMRMQYNDVCYWHPPKWEPVEVPKRKEAMSDGDV